MEVTNQQCCTKLHNRGNERAFAPVFYSVGTRGAFRSGKVVGADVKNNWRSNSVPFICLYDLHKDNLSFTSHLSTAQAVGCRPVAVHTQVHSAASLCEIFVRCPLFWHFCYQYHAINTSYSHFIHLPPTPYGLKQFTGPLNTCKTRLSRLHLPDTYFRKSHNAGVEEPGTPRCRARWTVVSWNSFVGRYVDIAQPSLFVYEG
jgi:hypothetical protein